MARTGPKGASDELKATALVMLEIDPGHLDTVASDLGVAKSTLWRWSKGRNIDDMDKVLELKEEARLSLGPRLDAVADQLVGKLTDKLTHGDIDKMNVKDLAIALGIVIEKSRLVRGEATNISGNTDKAKAGIESKLGNLKKNLQGHEAALKMVDGGADESAA